MMKAQFITSRAGKRKLTHEGFAYIHNVTSPNKKRIYWKCELFRRKCQARAVTDNEDNLVQTTEHAHPPYAEEIERREMEGPPKFLTERKSRKQPSKTDTTTDKASVGRRVRHKKIIIKSPDAKSVDEHTQESDKENCSTAESDASPKSQRGKKLKESDTEESSDEDEIVLFSSPKKLKCKVEKKSEKKRDKTAKAQTNAKKKNTVTKDPYACDTESSQEEESDKKKRRRKPTKKGEEFEKTVKEKAKRKATKLNDNTESSQQKKKSKKRGETDKEHKGKKDGEEERKSSKEKQDSDSDSDNEVLINIKHNEEKKTPKKARGSQTSFISKYFTPISKVKSEPTPKHLGDTFTNLKEKKKDMKEVKSEEKFDSMCSSNVQADITPSPTSAGDRENTISSDSQTTKEFRHGGRNQDKEHDKGSVKKESENDMDSVEDLNLHLDESPSPRKSPRKNLGMKEKDPDFLHGKEMGNGKAPSAAENSPSGGSGSKRSKLSLSKRVKEGSPAVQRINFNPKEGDPAPGKPCMPVKSNVKTVAKQEDKSVAKATKDKSNGISSFENLGNTCYLNSVLQVLRHTPGLTEKISLLAEEIQNTQTEWGNPAMYSQVNEDDEKIERPTCTPAVWKLVKMLRELFARMNNLEALYLEGRISGLTIKPDKLMDTVCKVNPMFDGNLQQDAHELLMCMLCWIQDATKELNKYRKQHKKLPGPLSVNTGDKQSLEDRSLSPGSSSSVRGPLDKFLSPKSKVLPSLREAGVSQSQKSPPAATVAKSPSCGMVQANLEPTQASDIAYSLKGARQLTDFTEVPEASKTLPVESSTANYFNDGSPTQPGKRKRAHSTSELELDETSGLFVQRKRQCMEEDSPKQKLKRSPSCSDLSGSSLDRTEASSVRRNLLGAGGMGPQGSANITLKALLTADLGPGPAGDGSRPSSQCKVHIPPESPVKLIDFKSRASVKLERDGIRKYFVAQDKKPKLGKELKRNTKVIPDVVESLFQGTLAQQTRCLECEHQTERKEAFHDISVAVRKDRKKMLTAGEDDSDEEEERDDLKWLRSAFSEVERLQGENKYFCDKCYHLVEAERSQHYRGLPEILTLHLKRFAHTQNGFFCKINDHIPTPMELPCLQKGCPSPCPQSNHTYELYAVITHVGISLSAGHYTAYIKVPHTRDKESESSTLVGMNFLSQKLQHTPFTVKGHHNNGRLTSGSSSAPSNGATKNKDGNNTECVQEVTSQQGRATAPGASCEAADPNNNADANNNLSTAEQQPSTSSSAASTAAAGTSQNSTENRLVLADEVKPRSSSRWIECDDDTITLLSEEKFRRMLSPSSSGTPYILMYRRCSD